MTRRTGILTLVPMLCAFSAPALADYVRIGSVDVGFRMDRDSAWSRFGGGMEGLRLVASASDIACRDIRVTFGDGTTQNVFRGVLQEETPVDVDVRGGMRRVNRIDFVCRSDRMSGGKIFIAADVGHFREEWQRSPEWASTWSRVFNWGPAVVVREDDPNYWVSLGRERFVGRRDVESRFAGWGGRSVDRIALRPIDGDARCTRILATFGNGRTRALDVSQLNRMAQGRNYRIDLPGEERRITRLDLTCRALGDRDVTMEILARK
jgi:hypothetical protein